MNDGRVLFEGAAILQYLADLKPERCLAPANGTFERYKLQEMLGFLATEIHKGFIRCSTRTSPVVIWRRHGRNC